MSLALVGCGKSGSKSNNHGGVFTSNSTTPVSGFVMVPNSTFGGGSSIQFVSGAHTYQISTQQIDQNSYSILTQMYYGQGFAAVNCPNTAQAFRCYRAIVSGTCGNQFGNNQFGNNQFGNNQFGNNQWQQRPVACANGSIIMVTGIQPL